MRSATVEKWKTEDLTVYEANTWLAYQEVTNGGKKCCSLLKCNVCCEFEEPINKRHNFTRTFIDGSTNFKISSVIDHARSEIHKIALNLSKERVENQQRQS